MTIITFNSTPWWSYLKKNMATDNKFIDERIGAFMHQTVCPLIVLRIKKY